MISQNGLVNFYETRRESSGIFYYPIPAEGKLGGKTDEPVKEVKESGKDKRKVKRRSRPPGETGSVVWAVIASATNENKDRVGLYLRRRLILNCAYREHSKSDK